jgi:hypothetical protein
MSLKPALVSESDMLEYILFYTLLTHSQLNMYKMQQPYHVTPFMFTVLQHTQVPYIDFLLLHYR